MKAIVLFASCLVCSVTTFALDRSQTILFGLTPEGKTCAVNFEVDTPKSGESFVSFLDYTNDIDDKYDNYWQDSVITLRWSFNHVKKENLGVSLDSGTLVLSNLSESGVGFKMALEGVSSLEDVKSLDNLELEIVRSSSSENYSCKIKKN